MAIIKRKPEAVLTIAQGKSRVKPFLRKKPAIRIFDDDGCRCLQKLFFCSLLCYTCSHHLNKDAAAVLPCLEAYHGHGSGFGTLFSPSALIPTARSSGTGSRE